jgi:hypothetical protein
MKKVLIAGFLLALSNVVVASSEDELTSLSYISYLERYATVQPSSQEESLEAVINMPLVAGDRVDTAREARMEVVLADGNYLWLDEYTTLSLDAVAFSRDTESERTVVFLAEGSIIFEVSEFSLSERPVRFDSRGATVYLDERGVYRIHALANGGLRVEVISGLAEAATTAGGVLVRAQSSAEVGGGEVQRSEMTLTPDDDFAAWVDMRRQVTAGESTEYVDLRYSRQAAQLDNYGSWVYVDTINSWAWQPAVGGSWEPYRAGRWYWTAPGWAWISYEPWGWLPYHYGSWYLDAGFGWVWSWGAYWGPAWVNWVWWPGYVGWCPYGYYNSWYWNSYGGYYPGYYPPYGPRHPVGGGGHVQPPRRDVVPPRTVSARGGGGAGQSRAAALPAVDIEGRVRMAEVDRRGWTVARQEEFASPNLARLARSGERAMPTEGDEMGVVMTGPLSTRSPSLASPRSEIERVFRGVEARTPTDVSPLLARDGSLSSDTVQRLAQPTTYADLSRRSESAAASNRVIVAPRLSTGTGSPLYSSTTQRRTEPNVYRPNLSTGNGSISGSLRGSRSIGGRQVVVPRTGTGLGTTSRPSYVAPNTSSGRSSGSSRPVIVPPTGSSTSRSPTTGAQPRGSSMGSPSSGRTSPGSSSSPRSSSVGSTRSSSGGSSRGAASSSRPSGGASSSRHSSSGSGSRQR